MENWDFQEKHNHTCTVKEAELKSLSVENTEQSNELKLGLWRYWILYYRGEAATNIAVWRLIARPPPPPVKIFFDVVALVQMHGLLLLRAAEPLHIVAGLRFHWSPEEMHFQQALSG